MNKQNILIIEDTPMQIRVLDQILSPIYDLKIATNGKKGIELAGKHQIDLILLDILMEDMSGYDVLDILKSDDKTKNIPVIFITSMDSTKDEVKGLSSGAVDYITKPFVPEIVLLRIGLHMQLIGQMRTIEKLSLYDSLTGIRNRRSFNLTMNDVWGSPSLSMIMIDIDKFKSFNDKHGHLSGDVCLRTVANVIKSFVKTDFVFRWGGEEFAILLTDTTLPEAKNIAEQLRIAVESTLISLENGTSTSVTISLGVGIPKESDRPEDFCETVDKALYRAKENGRNRVEVVI